MESPVTLSEKYEKSLKGHDNFNNMTVAISHPKKRRDTLSTAKLNLTEGLNLPTIIQNLNDPH
jgi:hypothetical protein